MSSTRWQTTKRAGIACGACGTIGTCTVSPDRTAFKCWRDGGNVHQMNGGASAAGAGTGYIGEAHRKAKSAKGRWETAEAAIEAIRRTIEGATLAGVWTYPVDAMRVLRFDLLDGDKTFRPIHRKKDGWREGDPSGPLPLYRRDELPDAGPVWICEGEKAADAARAIGLAAVTSAHGSSAPEKTDWTPLAGKAAVILPDADEPGRKYARTVATILVKLDPPARVKVVKLPGLPEGGDVVEFIAARPDAGADAIRVEIEKLAAAVPWIKPVDLIGGPVLTCLANVEARAIQWLWPERVALGRITLLVGRQGEGKSLLTMEMAAHVTTGTPWPDGSDCPAGSVILISAEDDPGDTIRPRLDACGADCRKVHLLPAVRRVSDDGTAHEMMFTLADVKALETALKSLPDCRLIVVDPIGSFLGGDTDAHRDNEVRGVLAPVARLAEKYGPAVLVVAHRRKGTGSIADDLAMGSRAFTAIARAVWHLTRDAENKARRLLLPGKNNLAPEGEGLAFTICGDPPAIAWERDPVAMSADDALAVENGGGDESKPGPEPEAMNAAKQWLAKLLADGEVEAAKVKAEAKAAGLAWRTVQRAADILGVIREKNAFNSGWQWRLPKPGGEDANRRCQTPQEQENLASWHLGQNQGKNGDSLCQDTEDAKFSDLGILGENGRERGEL